MDYRFAADPEEIESIRRRFPRSFTKHHERLLDICIERIRPRVGDIQILDTSEQLDVADLRNLQLMVEAEFAASLAKEMTGTEDASSRGPSAEPHPYDVFLMERTMERSDMRLAVCIPMDDDLVWYNGLVDIWQMEPCSHKWRVASLSGAARVLEALSRPPSGYPLMHAAMKRDLIVEAADGDVGNLSKEENALDPSILENLNDSQRRAVLTVASPLFQTGFFVIQGPPGCGKTTTLVSMILAALEQRNDKRSVLVLAPSNAAVANVALKFWSVAKRLRPHYSWSDVLVHGENCDPSVQFLNPRHRGERFSNLWKQLVEDETSHTQRAALQDRLQREFLAWLHFRIDEEDISMADLARICPYIDTSTKEGRDYYARKVRHAKVIFCTLNSSGSGVLQGNAQVSTCMLDEAGQCTEAEFHIATTFPNVERMVVMGDPKQLPSTVIEPQCRIAGYGRSWLEIIFHRFPSKVHLLDTQYRMDPEILKFPNRTFYQDRIQSGDIVLVREPFVSKPFVFVDTDRRGHEELEDFSWHNVYEVTVIKALLFNDEDIVRLLREKEDARVIVISPYKAQAKFLRQHLKLPFVRQLEIATVDSFQGQEGDVVVISTVRTHRVGFVDNPQRLNVALTRAKRILRVVGDAAFFRSLSPSSTLRKLTVFAHKSEGMLETSKINCSPWSRPNWKQQTLWKPTMSQRFIGCLYKMSPRNKNICMNTLFAVAKGDLSVLYPRIPLKAKPSWYMSCLKGFQEMRVVWIAKMLDTQAIEAAFAGTYRDCLRFTQIHSAVPSEALIVHPGLGRLISHQNDVVDKETGQEELVISWPVTNTMQHVLVSGAELPLGSVQLDSFQEEVARSRPPLIIESRSGTGKTLVLLQHAAYHADFGDARPACFVTVSFRLRNELEQRYIVINQAENLRLPDTMFFTFDNLLYDLLKLRRIPDFQHKGRSTYLGFESSKKSHERAAIEPHLVENEIGGVILGSLEAAKQRLPLTREQYLVDLRSNIGNETDHDIRKRHQVYTEYEKYDAWKYSMQKFDVGDIVLRLLREDWNQHFSSGYLDEIQDLSYAAIFLICKLAGNDTLRWVCAGDPAQMISPGCSFTFDGLKQTLLTLQSGIESRLSRVSHFLVNYRTSKDILVLANQVLAVARREFPGAIPFARKEVAKKDLGLKVVLCDWDTAMKQQIKLGTNQAIVFSSPQPDDLETKLTDWVGNHPFIVSSLQSKGLEFDDVIVAFDHDRKTWNVTGKREASLRMLRELYVAVTRAQQRVVVLVKRSVPEMQRFYDQLGCDFLIEGAELVLKEFHTVASSADWRNRARDFFDNEEFQMAARCFDIAGDQGWCHWSSGKYWVARGADAQAGAQFLVALEKFAEKKDYEQVLDVSLALVAPSIACKVGWDKSKDAVVEEAIAHRPHRLKRFDLVRLSLARSAWHNIATDDLKDQTLSSLFVVYRGHASLKKIVQDAGDGDRIEIQNVLPLVVGDFHVDGRGYAKAVSVFLCCNSVPDATDVTHRALRDARAGKRQSELHKIVDLWENNPKRPLDPVISLLVELFQFPQKIAEAKGKECLHYLGRSVVISAVDRVVGDRTILHQFSHTAFRLEVTDALVSTCKKDQVKVVRWFLEKHDQESALAFVQKRQRKWTDLELLVLVEIVTARPNWLFHELVRRKLLPSSMLVVLGSSLLNVSCKYAFIKSLSLFRAQFRCKEEKHWFKLAIDWALNQVVSDTSGSGRVGRQEKGEEATLDSNPMTLKKLSHNLLVLWPEIGHVTPKKTEKPSVLTEEVCENLLFLVYNTSSDCDKKALVQVLGKDKMVTKAFSPILRLCFQQEMIPTAKDVTWAVFRSKNLSDTQIYDIVEIWSQMGRMDTSLSILSKILQLKKTTAKQREGLMNRMPAVLEVALRKKDRLNLDMAFAFTSGVLKLRLVKDCGVLKILNLWDSWVRNECGCKQEGMLRDPEALVSFLLLLVAEKSPVGLTEHDDDEDKSLLLSSYGGHVFTWTRRLLGQNPPANVLDELQLVQIIDQQKRHHVMIGLAARSFLKPSQKSEEMKKGGQPPAGHMKAASKKDKRPIVSDALKQKNLHRPEIEVNIDLQTAPTVMETFPMSPIAQKQGFQAACDKRQNNANDFSTHSQIAEAIEMGQQQQGPPKKHNNKKKNRRNNKKKKGRK